MPPSNQSEILRQLAEIHKQLGETAANVADFREDLKSHADNTNEYRDMVGQAFANIVTRLGNVERDVKVLKTTMEKTVKPLVTNSSNLKQRIIGFSAAVSLGGMVMGGLFWFLSAGIPAIVNLLKARGHLP